jgi:hypothetical protein
MTDEHDLIIQQLGLHPSATRVKKLMVYACSDRWESDAQVLAAAEWPALIHQLRQLHPTPEHLRARLDALVGTLNKQAEYFSVVSIITDALAQFYPKLTPIAPQADDIPTQIETTAQVVSVDELSKSFVVQALTNEPDCDRLKKLLICATRQYWETNNQKLSTITFTDLVTELKQQQPTLVDLQTTLDQVVQNLSKPVEYRLVADVLIRHLQPLLHNPASAAIGIPAEAQANIDSDKTVPDLAAPAALPVRQTALPRGQETKASKSINLFDLRLEVMKTTNPLRAKILLFSILYYDFNYQAQDWANLQLYSLDGLMRSVLKVCDTWDAVESNLRDVAQRQHDAVAYTDVLTALIKCFKLAYAATAHFQAIKTVSSADATQVVQNDATAIEINDDATEIDANQEATLIEPPQIITRWAPTESPVSPPAMTEIFA